MWASHRVFLLLIVIVFQPLSWAEGLADPARELARKIAAAPGSLQAVAVTVRNLSSLNAAQVAEVRRALGEELRRQGVKLGETNPAATEVRVTLSENRQNYVWVAEVGHGSSLVQIVESPRPTAAPPQPAPTLVIEKKQVWEQQEPILDLALVHASGPEPEGLLVLGATKVSLYQRQGDRWELAQSAVIPTSKPWPRDPRGRLFLERDALRAHLPGAVCRGPALPSLKLDCRESNEPWPLQAGSRILGHGYFTAGQNFFEGRLLLAGGVTKNLPAFYSVAAVEKEGGMVWALAGLDGRAQVYDKALEPAGVFGPVGSDLAALQTQCGSGWQVLATKGGGANELDAVQAYDIVDRQTIPVSQPVELPGPVSALWPAAGGTTAIAVARNLATGRHAAFSLAISCSR